MRRINSLKTGLSLGAVLLASSLLAGCQQTGNAIGETVSSGAKTVAEWIEGAADPEINALVLAASRQADIDPEDLEGPETLINYMDACDNSQRPIETDFEAGLFEVRQVTHGVWPVQKAEAYLNAMLDRIVACAPFEPLPAKVKIVARAGVNATAFEDGLIAFNLDVLKENTDDPAKTLTEPSIAFLVAHEYAHYLLKHHEARKSSQTRGRIASLITEAAFLADDYLSKTGKGPDLSAKLKNPAIANKTVEVLFDQPWGRLAEHEADMLGAHLAILAGYPVHQGHTNTAISVIHERRSLTERLEDLALQKRETFANDIVQAGITGGKQGLKEMFSSLANDVAQTSVEALSSTHPTAEERITMLAEYFSTHVVGRTYGQRRAKFGEPELAYSLDSVRSDREFKAASKAFNAALEVHNAVFNAPNLAALGDLDGGVDGVIKKARLGVSGPKPWFETNTFGRLAFASLRLMQDDKKNAKTSYRMAVSEGESAPIVAFERMIDLQILEKDIEGAQETLSLAEETFGVDNIYLFPMRLKTMTAAEQNITSVATGCRLSGNPSIARLCRYWAWDNPGS